MPLREMRPLGVPCLEMGRTAEEEKKVLEEVGSSPLARQGLVCLTSLQVATLMVWWPTCV